MKGGGYLVFLNALGVFSVGMIFYCEEASSRRFATPSHKENIYLPKLLWIDLAKVSQG